MFGTTYLWSLRFGWLLVISLYKEDYLQLLKCASYDYKAVVVGLNSIYLILAIIIL